MVAFLLTSLLFYIKKFPNCNITRLKKLNNLYIDSIKTSNFNRDIDYWPTSYIANKFIDYLNTNEVNTKKNYNKDFTIPELEKLYKIIKFNPIILKKYNEFSNNLSNLIIGLKEYDDTDFNFQNIVLNTNKVILKNLYDCSNNKNLSKIRLLINFEKNKTLIISQNIINDVITSSKVDNVSCLNNILNKSFNTTIGAINNINTVLKKIYNIEKEIMKIMPYKDSNISEEMRKLIYNLKINIEDILNNLVELKNNINCLINEQTKLSNNDLNINIEIEKILEKNKQINKNIRKYLNQYENNILINYNELQQRLNTIIKNDQNFNNKKSKNELIENINYNLDRNAANLEIIEHHFKKVKILLYNNSILMTYLCNEFDTPGIEDIKNKTISNKKQLKSIYNEITNDKTIIDDVKLTLNTIKENTENLSNFDQNLSIKLSDLYSNLNNENNRISNIFNNITSNYNVNISHMDEYLKKNQKFYFEYKNHSSLIFTIKKDAVIALNDISKSIEILNIDYIKINELINKINNMISSLPIDTISGINDIKLKINLYKIKLTSLSSKIDADRKIINDVYPILNDIIINVDNLIPSDTNFFNMFSNLYYKLIIQKNKISGVDSNIVWCYSKNVPKLISSLNNIQKLYDNYKIFISIINFLKKIIITGLYNTEITLSKLHINNEKTQDLIRNTDFLLFSLSTNTDFVSNNIKSQANFLKSELKTIIDNIENDITKISKVNSILNILNKETDNLSYYDSDLKVKVTDMISKIRNENNNIEYITKNITSDLNKKIPLMVSIYSKIDQLYDNFEKTGFFGDPIEPV